MSVEKIMPTLDIVKNFIDNNYSDKNVNSSDLAQRVLKVYNGDKVIFNDEEANIYNAFKDFYKSTNVTFLTKALSSLLNNIDASIEDCDKNNHELRKVPLDSVANLLSNINYSERFLLNKKVPLVQEINSILNSSDFKQFLASTKSKFGEKNIKNVVDFYLGNNGYPLTHVENKMYNQLSNKMRKVEALNKYNFGRLNDEVSYMLKSFNIDKTAYPDEEFYKNLNFDISSLYTDEDLIKATQKDLDAVRAFVQSSVSTKSFSKPKVKVQYCKDENNFNGKEIFISTLNLDKYENNEYKNIMEAVNILYTYNLKNICELLPTEKQFDKYIKSHLNDYVMNSSDMQQLKHFDFSNKQDEFVQIIALINTLNMSEVFLNKKSLEVVEKNLTSCISNLMLNVACTDVDRFNYYFDQINKIVKESTNDNFMLYKQDLKDLTTKCKVAFNRLGDKAKADSKLRMKVVNDLATTVLNKNYSFVGNESTQAKAKMKNVIQKQSNALFLTEELANRFVLYKITELAKSNINELKNSLALLSLTSKSYFYNMFVDAKLAKKMDANEIRNEIFNNFKALLTNKGYAYENSCSTFTDLFFGAKSRAEDASLIKYYANGVLSGNLFDLLEGTEINIEDKLNFNDILNASMDKFNYSNSLIYAGELKKAVEQYGSLSLTNKDLATAIDQADEISKDKHVVDASVNLDSVINLLVDKVNNIKEEENVHICATNSELVSIAKDLILVNNIKDTLSQLKDTNVNIQTVNKEDVKGDKFVAYRQICKSSVSKKLSNAVAKGLGSHNVVVKNFDRNKNPELIFANFPAIENADKKELSNIINNIARYYSVTDKNKKTIQDEGNFFSIINLISNTLKNLSESIISKVEKLDRGNELLAGCAKSKDYSALNEKANEMISKYVEKQYGVSFDLPEENVDYFIDKLLIDVAQSYRQSKNEKQSVKYLRNNLKTNVLDKLVNQFETKVTLKTAEPTKQVEMVK